MYLLDYHHLVARFKNSLVVDICQIIDTYREIHTTWSPGKINLFDSSHQLIDTYCQIIQMFKTQ
jgi:hypothetical protein